MKNLIKNPFVGSNLQKVAVVILCMVFLARSFASCVKNEETEGTEEDDTLFYYCFDEKIFFQQIKDKIYLKFTQEAQEEQLISIVNSDASLQPTSYIYLGEGTFRFVVLESKDGLQIPLAAIESFKTRQEVVSATYLLLYNGIYFQGLTDEFVVKLKETTSNEQLQKLAEKNGCKVGAEDSYVKNQFMMYVSKNSKSDAMKLSNLFYETGLFEFAEPNLVVLLVDENQKSEKP